MPFKEKPDDEGIMVSFGDFFDGSGFGDAMAGEEDVIPTEPAQQEQKSSPQEYMTQDTKKSLPLPNQTQATIDQKRAQEIEQQKREAKAKQDALLAEERRKKEIEASSQNLVGGAFGKSGTGSGNTSGDSRQGNPAGKGNSGGHGWSLSGRDLRGSIATPNYPSNVEGVITVRIRVDQSGRVVESSIGSPSNISDAQTRNAALDAAKRTTFTAGDGVVSGTITYNFKLK